MLFGKARSGFCERLLRLGALSSRGSSLSLLLVLLVDSSRVGRLITEPDWLVFALFSLF